MKKSIFKETTEPYYIASPDYAENSAGIMALHHLCHALNISGFEAYIYGATKTSPNLRTPLLDANTQAQHKNKGKSPIAVYPEIITGNPLGVKTVVRFMLNKEGVIRGNKIEAADSDIFFYYSEYFTPENEETSNILTVPVINSKIIKPNNRVKNKKPFLYLNRIPESDIDLKQFQGNIEILSNKRPIPLDQLTKKLQTASALYSFEFSGTCIIAMLCGCPVVTLNHPKYEKYGFTEQNLAAFAYAGYTRSNTESGISEAKKNLPLVRKHVQNIEKSFWKKLEYFTQITQQATHKIKNSLPLLQAPPRAAKNSYRDDDYLRWLEGRDMLIGQSAPAVLNRESDQAAFQIIIRVAPDEEAALASTLDTLAGQIHAGWHLDILTVLPAPDGLTEIPCISWHELGGNQNLSIYAKKLVTDGEYDFVIELPAGVRLDVLYLWRLAKAASSNPDCAAFFVDDDRHNNDGVRSSPRLKPGVNPAALLESDLAGPLCLRRQEWLAAATHPETRTPWFDKLLSIAEKQAWGALCHIPDILLSLPETDTLNTTENKAAVQALFLRQKTTVETLDSGSFSWHIRYPLEQSPMVTLAIVSGSDVLNASIIRCLETIHRYTRYPAYEILICKAGGDADPELLANIERWRNESGLAIQLIAPQAPQTYAALCNLAAQASTTDFLVLLDEEAQIIQDSWLTELLRNALQPGIAAVLPCQIQPGSSLINCAGPVLGLNGLIDSPYRGQVKYGTAVPLNWLKTTRDVGSLPKGGILLNKASYLDVGGMDENLPVAELAFADLGLKLRTRGQRLIYQPLSNIVYQPPSAGPLPESAEDLARKQLDHFKARDNFTDRWWPTAVSDPFWNPNLSLSGELPGLETQFLPPWHVVPNPGLRILARPVTNGQGYYRVTAPLDALQTRGYIQRCIWDQGAYRPAHPAELLRLRADVLVVQNHVSNSCLQELRDLQRFSKRPFIIQALDDLITGVAESNPLRVTLPPNPAERMQRSLAYCDRLIVTTDYLAEYHSHQIRDIMIVPNRLERALWLPLSSKKRVGSKPRIGWAGGITHQDDLLLLEEIISATRTEADWIFMGMCPESIRPLLAEYHPLVDLADYPGYLASLNFDIAVAPLAEIPFNRAKSNLRLLEYGVLGIPVVCTDIDPYRNSPACRVKNTPTAWIEALRARIHDPEAREKEGQIMREWVLQNYILEDHLDQWLKAHLPS